MNKKLKLGLIAVGLLVVFLATAVMLKMWVVLAVFVLLMILIGFLVISVNRRSSNTVDLSQQPDLSQPTQPSSYEDELREGTVEIQTPASYFQDLSFVLKSGGKDAVDLFRNAGEVAATERLRHAAALGQQLCDNGACPEDVMMTLRSLSGEVLPNSVKPPRKAESNYRPRKAVVRKRFGVPTWIE